VPRVSARILVVDAEAALAALICETLAAEGHRAVAAHDANEALLRLTGEPFDLLVSDASLPGLSAIASRERSGGFGRTCSTGYS